MKELIYTIQSHRTWFYCLIFFFITLIVTFSKFSPGVFIEKTQPSNPVIFSDDIEYIQYVNFFKDIKNQRLPIAPFSYRPLTPFLASFLPFEPRTSINIINILALYVSTVLIFILAKAWFSGGIPLACALLHLISFNSYYYCANARVDSLSVLFITMLLVFTVNQRIILFGLCFAIGLLAKETVIISLVPFFFYTVTRANLKKMLLILIVFILVFLIEQHLIRRFFSSGTGFYWIPSLTTFFGNIARPRAIISFFLSLGLPGLLSLIFLFRDWRAIVINKTLLALFLGFFSSIVLYFFSLTSAYADGRFIWICSPYICLISGFYLKKIGMFSKG